MLTGLCFLSNAFAQEKVSAEDKIIGSTFKALAKGFVAVSDIDKLKAININKLNRMDTVKFKKRYAKAYEVIKDLPANLKVNYGIAGDMPKERAIRSIKSLDKDKIYAAIDAVPDAFIARQFKQYISKKGQDIQKSSLVVEINKFWNKIIGKAGYALR